MLVKCKDHALTAFLVPALPLQTAQRAAEAIALSEQLLAGLEYRLNRSVRDATLLPLHVSASQQACITPASAFKSMH